MVNSAYASLLELFHQHFGIDITHNTRTVTERQIETVIAEAAEKQRCTPEQFLDNVSQDPELLLELSQIISVGETYFLRYEDQLQVALSHAHSLCETDRFCPVPIWCAGCSSGEEVFSLALLAEQRWPTLAPQLIIQGSDVCGASIEKARQKQFGAWSFRNVSNAFKTAHFEHAGDECNHYQIKNKLAATIQFRHESIQDRLAQMPAQSLGIVFFRNVSIYLTPKSTAEIFSEMTRVLIPGGMMVIAPTDVHPTHSLLKPMPNAPSGIYVKPTDADKKVATTQAATPSVIPPSKRTTPSRPYAQKKRRRHIASHPPDSSATPSISLITQVEELINNHQLDAALTIIDQYPISSTLDYVPHYLKGKIYFDQKEYDKAESHLKHAAYLKPGDEMVQLWLTMVLFERGDRVRCAKKAHALKQRLKLYPPHTLLSDQATTVAQAEQTLTLLLESR